MLKILLGFLPWILFSALYGPTEKEIIISIAVATAVMLKTEWRTLQKGYVLTWGTLLFFCFMFIFAVIVKNAWVINHANLISNLAITIIAWGSLIIGKPFTLQYAREETPKFIWKNPGFIKVNQIITAFWGSVFLLSTLLYIIPFGHTTLDRIMFQLLMYGSIVLAIWFTQAFPTWYRRRKQRFNNQHNYYLQGNYAPIREENDFNHLTSSAKIPADLQGVYMRNGANSAYEPISYVYPFDGDGMIHAMYLNNSSANYRNRYVKTKGLLLEQRVGHAVYGGIMTPMPLDKNILEPSDDTSPFKNGAFIHIICHANRFLAMSESSPAYEMDIQLNTIGEWCPGTEKPLPSSPHTRLDPDTEELFLITYDVDPPFLICHQIDKNGVLAASKIIDKPNSTMMHDFAMTKNYCLFFDCPAVLEINARETGNDFLQWREELGTRIGIMSRDDFSKEVLWLNTAAFFVFHFANAYEIDHTIIVDYVRHNRLGLAVDSNEEKLPPQLYRMIIDLDNKTVTESKLCDAVVEFPTFNLDYNTKKYQYIYAPTKKDTREFTTLIKHDLINGATSYHDFGNECEIGEAVFAPRPSSRAEDDGYLMLFVYDKKRNSSDFVIIDAQNFSGNPATIINLPRRVPHGLHGSWIPKLFNQELAL